MRSLRDKAGAAGAAASSTPEAFEGNLDMLAKSVGKKRLIGLIRYEALTDSRLKQIVDEWDEMPAPLRSRTLSRLLSLVPASANRSFSSRRPARPTIPETRPRSSLQLCSCQQSWRRRYAERSIPRASRIAACSSSTPSCCPRRAVLRPSSTSRRSSPSRTRASLAGRTSRSKPSCGCKSSAGMWRSKRRSTKRMLPSPTDVRVASELPSVESPARLRWLGQAPPPVAPIGGRHRRSAPDRGRVCAHPSTRICCPRWQMARATPSTGTRGRQRPAAELIARLDRLSATADPRKRAGDFKRRRQPRWPPGSDPFKDLAEPFRTQARTIFARLCDKWSFDLPDWRKAILAGRARWLAVHPPDSAWGRSMFKKRGGDRKSVGEGKRGGGGWR